MASDVSQGYLQCRFCGTNFKRRGYKKHQQHCKYNPDALARPISSANLLLTSARRPTHSEMASDGPQENCQCSFCHKDFEGRRSCAEHELQCKNNQDPHSQTEPSGNAQGGIGIWCVHVPRQKRTARNQPLPEQHLKKPASDYAQGGTTDAPETPPKPTTSEVKVDFAVNAPDINIPEHKYPSVMQKQKKKLDLNLQPHSDSSDPDAQADSFSSIDDLSTIDTNSDKQKKTITGVADTNIPDHKDPSTMQMQIKLDLNLPPHDDSFSSMDDLNALHSDSSDPEAQADSFSSIDDLSTIDTNSDKQKKTITGVADTNIPDHKDPSSMQMQIKLDLKLPPHDDSFSSMDDLNALHSDSSDPEAQAASFSSIDHLSTIDTNSDKQKKTITGVADTNIPDHKDPSMMQMQIKLDLNLPPHDDSFSSMDDLNSNSHKEKKTDNGGVTAYANSDKEKRTDNGSFPAGINSVKEKKTDNGGVDINIPDHKDPSEMRMQNKLDLNLPPCNESFSSMDDLKALAPIDTNSDKETNTVNGGADTNIPGHIDPSVMQMKNKLDLNLPPHNDSSDSLV